MLSERSVELPWLISRIGKPRRILDIGSADGTYTGILYELCRDLYLCDTREFTTTVPAQVFVGSAHQLPEAWAGTFDLITCVSVLDHVGLAAYDNAADSTLLEQTVAEMGRVLAKDGRLLLTVPFGRDQVTTHPGGAQRVFGKKELLHLLAGWRVQAAQVWKLCSERYEQALTMDDVAMVNYAQWRAGAVIALELKLA
jgi:SAM-dependent methyltransferase